MKLIALNLPRDFSEQDLVELFKVYGNVIACDLVLDDETGSSKGFAFVEMELEQDALNAIDKLHESKIKKHKIRVKSAK
ncbi:hypothetical protein A9Q83_13485 [Alphaproteobacteria bacterium 46_93_T64]|nr:hypothetical protein A9Q83_13485 [Alphaproteobacteria bacterium 46_93_T64]